MHLTLLHRSISRRSYGRLSALKPIFVSACSLWRSQRFRLREHFHDCPQLAG
jgi:hypothetical protein